MTIFKVSSATLEAAQKEMEDDKESKRLLRDLQVNVDNFSRYVTEVRVLKGGLKKVISMVWKQADQKLKDHKLRPDTRKAFVEVRATTDRLWRELDKIGF